MACSNLNALTPNASRMHRMLADNFYAYHAYSQNRQKNYDLL